MSNGNVECETMGPIFAALRFAAQKHSRQRRKDSEATPYINHPIAVAETLVRVGGICDVETLQAAILHDTVEDTETTPEELEAEFGARVRTIVLELSDQKGLSKEVRKRMEVEHAPHLSDAGKRIKLADKLCNLLDISLSQPEKWDHQRKLDYCDFAERIAAGCSGCCEPLERRFAAVLREKREELRGVS